MILKSVGQDPRKLKLIGMTFLLLAFASKLVRPSAVLGGDALDFVRGLLFGVAIGFSLWAVYMYGRQRRQSTRN